MATGFEQCSSKEREQFTQRPKGTAYTQLRSVHLGTGVPQVMSSTVCCTVTCKLVCPHKVVGGISPNGGGVLFERKLFASAENKVHSKIL